MLEQLRMFLVELHLLGRADGVRREHHALDVGAREHLTARPLQRLHDGGIAIQLVVHRALHEQLFVDERIRWPAWSRPAWSTSTPRTCSAWLSCETVISLSFTFATDLGSAAALVAAASVSAATASAIAE